MNKFTKISTLFFPNYLRSISSSHHVERTHGVQKQIGSHWVNTNLFYADGQSVQATPQSAQGQRGVGEDGRFCCPVRSDRTQCQ